MEVKLRTIIEGSSDTTPNLRTVKRWGRTPTDTTMYDDTYSVYKRLVDGRVVGQFSLVQVYQLDASGNFIGDMSANTTACNISVEQMQHVASIQVPDEFSVDQKMSMLTNYGADKWGQPMRCAGDWEKAVDAKLIGAVYAGQPVEVIERRVFERVPWQGRIEAYVPMSRIRTGTLQKITVVDGQDRYGERLKGIVWIPLWFKTDSVWLFDRWLE